MNVVSDVESLVGESLVAESLVADNTPPAELVEGLHFLALEGLLDTLPSLLDPALHALPPADVDVPVVVDAREYAGVDLSEARGTKAEKNRATAVASRLLGITYRVLLLNDTRNARNS